MNSAPYPLPTYPFPADATLPYLACVPNPGCPWLVGRLALPLVPLLTVVPYLCTTKVVQDEVVHNEGLTGRRCRCRAPTVPVAVAVRPRARGVWCVERVSGTRAGG